MKIAVFLGAGFSYTGGVPLASQLFNDEPEVDRVVRERLVNRVTEGWRKWHANYGGQPEEYLQWLDSRKDAAWFDAAKFVGLVIALKMGTIQFIAGAGPTIVRHGVNRTTGIRLHEEFWQILTRPQGVDLTAVVTTNYDILAERGLRHTPRPRLRRPGFNYGVPGEGLEGGGYPSFTYIVPISTNGQVPLLKLHGSLTWSLIEGQIVRYIDCRPAIRGNALIVPPTTEKTIPDYMIPTWELAESHLRAADTWIVVGYSFPGYDIAVNRLFQNAAKHTHTVHVFDINPGVAERVKHLISGAEVHAHPGLPDGLEELRAIACTAGG